MKFCPVCNSHKLRSIAYDGKGNKVPKGSVKCYNNGCGYINIKKHGQSWENILLRTVNYQKPKGGRVLPE